MSDNSNQLATLAQNIKKGISNALKDLHTSMPGIIVTFDAATQMASIQPAVRRIFKTDQGDTELLTPSDLPILINVPVQFPRGGGYSLTFPVAKGDECLLVFCERSIDNWHNNGGVNTPSARRFHSLSDATAFVGISSLPNVVPNYSSTDTVLKKDDDTIFISLKADGNLECHSDSDVIIDAGGDITATAVGQADITAPTINLNGVVNISGQCNMNANATITGTLTNNGTNIGSNHVHSGVSTGPSNTGGPQ